MVQALVSLDEDTNNVLNVVKARYRLRDKGQAIKLVVNKYLEEPELRQDFIEKMKNIEKQESIRVKDFAKRYGLKKDV